MEIVTKVIWSIIILASFVLVGIPLSYNCYELNLIIILLGIGFIVYKTFIKKEKVIDNKIDFIVLAFYLAPIIPIVFGTCNSLEDTLVALIRNVSLFNIYIIAKNMANNSKQKEFTTSILIVGGLLLLALGIDERLSNAVFKYIKYLGIPLITNIENRMFSSLGYANSFAIIMAIEIFLCIGKLKNNKVQYSGFIYLFMFGMCMSYSRIAIVLFAITFIVYVIFLKKRKTYITYNIFQNMILTLVSIKLFEILADKYILAWLSLIIIFTISLVNAKLITKNYKKICKIKTKNYIIISVILCVFVIAVYGIGKQLDRPMHSFDENEINEEIRYKVYNIEPNKKYSFKFDYDAHVDEEMDIPVYRITIAEENKYYDTINTHELRLKNGDRKETINITTTEETVAVVIYIQSDYPRYQKGLTINSLYINNEKYGLNYLYLPTQLVERIESFGIKNKSLWERFVYYKDALKIIKQNFLFGLGDKGWKYNYEYIQTYRYAATEVHNFALQTFIDNGIIGFLLLIIIIVYAITRLIKKKSISEIDMAFVLLILHSLLDFDMSFYVIMIMWIILFALGSKNSKQQIHMVKEKILPIAIICLNIAIICVGIYTYNLYKENNVKLEKMSELKEKDGNKTIEIIKDFNEHEKYISQIYEVLYSIDYSCMNENNLEYVYEWLENKGIVSNVVYNVIRSQILTQIITTSTNNEYVTKFCNLIIDENKKMVDNITNTEKNRLTKNEKEYYLNKQNELYDLACTKIQEN